MAKQDGGSYKLPTHRGMHPKPWDALALCVDLQILHSCNAFLDKGTLALSA